MGAGERAKVRVQSGGGGLRSERAEVRGTEWVGERAEVRVQSVKYIDSHMQS